MDYISRSDPHFWRNDHIVRYGCKLQTFLITPIRLNRLDLVSDEYKPMIEHYTKILQDKVRTRFNVHPWLEYTARNEEQWYHRHRYYYDGSSVLDDFQYDAVEHSFLRFCCRHKRLIEQHCAILYVGGEYGCNYLCNLLDYPNSMFSPRSGATEEDVNNLLSKYDQETSYKLLFDN